MTIRFVADSTADLPKEAREAWDIAVAPLGVIFDEKLYLQDIDMSLEEFYAKLVTSKALPSTVQVNPDAFAQAFAPSVEAGDEIIVFCLSSALSGTYQSACIAMEQFPQGKIYLVDLRTVAMGSAILLARAVEMRDAGATAAEIVAEMEALSKRVVLYAVIDDLTYLHKGGRLSSVGMRVGGVLRLKPIVHIWEGVVGMAGLARGTKGAYQKIAEFMAKDGVDDRYQFAFGHTNAPHLMGELEQALFPAGNPYRTVRYPIGMVIGTHAGPGAVAVAYVKKNA